MSDFSRRQFIATAGVSIAGSLLLKGCLSNSPETGTTKSASPKVTKSGSGKLETKQAILGYLPIVESAPLIIAKEKGFFAKHGLTDVKVVKQANWGGARDNVEIGSAGGGIDGGQWQMPMPYMISQGLITKGNVKIPMYILAQLNTQGNSIGIAKKHKGKKVGLDLTQAKDYLVGMNKTGNPFQAAYTFPKANQDFWLRYWLAAGGIDPDKDVNLITVPSAQTVANMKKGTTDGFSTGDPWPYRLVTEKIGFISALTAEIWPNHPEEYLALRAEWVDKHPNAAKALLKAVMEAQQWCDKRENRLELAQIVSKPSYFNVPLNVLEGPYQGKYNLGDGKPPINDFKKATLYWKDGKGSVSYPYKSHDLWFLTESVRWGFLPKETLGQAKEWIDQVNREDLWKEAAKELGVPETDIPTSTSRGIETFFDGVKFDPEKPEAYLSSLKIKKV